MLLGSLTGWRIHVISRTVKQIVRWALFAGKRYKDQEIFAIYLIASATQNHSSMECALYEAILKVYVIGEFWKSYFCFKSG